MSVATYASEVPATVADRVTHAIRYVHDKVYRGTGGRVGYRLLGVPCLLLHTVGANPDVVAQIGTRRVPATAHVVLSDDPDYERLWKLANANNKQRYVAYQRRTTRRIPIVVLSPA
jgi:hypothetical protein